jgi:hypothetical protein
MVTETAKRLAELTAGAQQAGAIWRTPSRGQGGPLPNQLTGPQPACSSSPQAHTGELRLERARRASWARFRRLFQAREAPGNRAFGTHGPEDLREVIW